MGPGAQAPIQSLNSHQPAGRGCCPKCFTQRAPRARSRGPALRFARGGRESPQPQTAIETGRRLRPRTLSPHLPACRPARRAAAGDGSLRIAVTPFTSYSQSLPSPNFSRKDANEGAEVVQDVDASSVPSRIEGDEAWTAAASESSGVASHPATSWPGFMPVQPTPPSGRPRRLSKTARCSSTRRLHS